MKRLSERLTEAIEEEIATGALPPGARLDEVELAKRFGVSRTPIREALIQLHGEGLIENRPRRGAVVAQITPKRLIEMFELMAELEAMCARLAARRITPAALQAMDAVHDECRAAAASGDTDAYFYANERFHFGLYAASQNGYLTEQSLLLQRRLRPYRRLQLRVRNRLQRSFAEHQALLEALHGGDAEAAVQQARSHVLVQGERFADLIASLEQIGQRPAAAATTAAAAAATAVAAVPAAAQSPATVAPSAPAVAVSARRRPLSRARQAKRPNEAPD